MTWSLAIRARSSIARQLPGSIAAELRRLDPDTVYVIGGTGAVSDGVVRAMDAALP